MLGICLWAWDNKLLADLKATWVDNSIGFLDRLVTRDISRLETGRVTYVIWCNDEGRLIDDGTLFQLGEKLLACLAFFHFWFPTKDSSPSECDCIRLFRRRFL